MTSAKSIRNIYACLVHESRECVIDLVCNLHHLDPSSQIFLYNGGNNAGLLRGFPFERYNAVIHPTPRPMKWGWLHDFALDCLRFALESHPFDTMTIVDSDQLGVRAGYSGFLARALEGRSQVGLLGNVQAPRPDRRPTPPAMNALKEIDLWRPLLRRFPEGESKFAHWCFWPSTVFTSDAARDLVKLWNDPELQDILRRSRIWASEEVLFPTLVSVLGYEAAQSPCRYDLVRYRTRYSTAQLDAGFAQEDVFWVHPVPRRYDDPLRRHIRARFRSYEVAPPAESRKPELLLTWPILSEIRRIEGWLSDEEADLLIASVARALTTLPSQNVVEVGSFCGKATVVLGRVAEALGSDASIHVIDPLDGVVGAHDRGLQRLGPTREKLERNLRHAGISSRVRIHAMRAPAVRWDAGPIGFLLIDGLHDYASVSQDCLQLEPSLSVNGYVAFHDYADYYPGVKLFVQELLVSGCFRKVHCAGSLIVLQKLSAAARVEPAPAASGRQTPAPGMPVAARADGEGQPARPLVSCIMPTGDRRRFVPLSLRCFLQQDFPARELILVDDGADSIADLLPADPRIRYIRLDRKRSVGAKRNLACEEASGELIVHWDDDDWSAPHRLRNQVSTLLREQAEICGLTRVYYHQPATGRSWQYIYPPGQRPWVSGNTLGYTKECWRKTPFPDINVGEDARFIWSAPSRRLIALEDSACFVAMIHGTNVAPKRVNGSYWHPHDTEPIRALMGAEYEDYLRIGLEEAGPPPASRATVQPAGAR